MWSVYCLKLQEGKYYVGKTRNPHIRLDAHFGNGGSIWTQKYKPISIEYIKSDCDDFDEDKHVKMEMRKHGIDNVRGGSYSQLNLSINLKKILQAELYSSFDACFYCGKQGHFADKCPNKPRKWKVICYSCGRAGHYATECDYVPNKIVCYTCGTPGHTSTYCGKNREEEPVNVPVKTVYSEIIEHKGGSVVEEEKEDEEWIII